jgi:hypothetical protein
MSWRPILDSPAVLGRAALREAGISKSLAAEADQRDALFN